MTGYGSSSFSSDEVQIHLAVRSVNGRFLEVRFHLPKKYFPFEAELKRCVARHIKRGSVDIYINRREFKSLDQTSLTISPHLAKDWLRACHDLAGELDMEVGEMTVKDVVGAVEVIHFYGGEKVVGVEEREVLICELKKALQVCGEERLREGKALKAELLGHLKDLGAFVKSAESVCQEAHVELEQRFHKRLSHLEFLDEGRIDPQRFMQEVAIQIEKSDVNEEVTRLAEHIRSLEESLNSPDISGKKIDFYIQELLRETNTIGSKSSLTRLTQLVVDGKAIIERMREQVQNIE